MTLTSARQSTRVSLCLRLWLKGETRNRVLDSLRAMAERNEVKEACCDMEVCVSAVDYDAVIVVEEWESLEALEAHIRSTDFRAILAAMDLSSREPEVRVDHVSTRQGFEYLQNVLGSHE